MNTHRIGILYPSDGVLDREFWSYAPPGVSLHFTRIRFPDQPVTLEFVESLVEDPDICHGAENLRQIRPAAVVYACTCVSFARGRGGDQPIVDTVEKCAGAPATTTSTALASACGALGLRRVALAAPYVPEITERFEAFLGGVGVEVVSVKTLGLLGGVARTSAQAVADMIRAVDVAEAEGVVVANTNLSTVDAISELERDLAKPVVTAIQATMWHTCRLAGEDWTGGAGRLWSVDPVLRQPGDAHGS